MDDLGERYCLRMGIVLPQIVEVYEEAAFLDRLRIPYRFGAGHPDMHVGGGLDCSSAVSRILAWKAHILGSRTALDTEALASWGDPGEGAHLTIWVINQPEIHHCVAEFKVAHWRHWWAANHTGTLVGFFEGFDPTGYTARHWHGPTAS